MFSRDQFLPERASRPAPEAGDQGPWNVFILNDDVTPMDFVIHILMTIFLVPELSAAHVMYTAHLRGKAYVETLPAPEAVRRVGRARFAARLRSFPLEFSLEAA